MIVSGLPSDEEKLKLSLELGADEAVSNYDDLAAAVYRKNPYGANITCDRTGVLSSLKKLHQDCRAERYPSADRLLGQSCRNRSERVVPERS